MHHLCGVTVQNAHGRKHILRYIVLYAEPGLDAPSLDERCISVKVILENRDAPHNVSGQEDPFDSENVEPCYEYYLVKGLRVYHRCLCGHCPIRKVCCQH